MTVDELREALKGVDGNRIVVLSCDAEGNRYSPLAGAEEMVYDNDTKEVGYSEMTDELGEHGYTEEDVIDGEPAFVLWPV